MINILNKSDCVGCGACADICNKQAIEFKIDNEGFWYPSVIKEKCIDCGACETVCPVIQSDKLNKTNEKEPIVYSAYHTNHDVRFVSTTGGLYSALAEKILEEKGYIGGAVWTNEFGAKQIISNTSQDLPRLRGSKYLQSDSKGFYLSVRDCLRRNEKVLVCGCPCQMAALRSFLRYKEYDNLIIVDFICCSINSPKVFKEYIKTLEKQYNSRVVNYHPKNKEYGGWHSFSFKATFENGKVYHKKGMEDNFTQSFIGSHMAARPSCFECRFKKIPRVADITIADFWGIEKFNKKMDSPDGTSLVLLNNKKGKEFFESLGNKVVFEEQTIEEAIEGNVNLIKAIPHNAFRAPFYFLLNTLGFKYASLYSRVYSLLLRITRKISRVFHF